MGVGCLLLVLNMLIFAGIYYQRDRSRKKSRRGGAYCTNGNESGHGSPINGGGKFQQTHVRYVLVGFKCKYLYFFN